MKMLIALLLCCGSLARAMTEQAILNNGTIACRLLKLSNRQERLMEAIKALEEKKEPKSDDAYHVRNQWLVLLESVKTDMNILRDHSLHFYRRYRRELLTPLLAVYV